MLLNTAVLIVQSLVTGEIDAAANLVSLEGANINARRPGTASYISMVGQSRDHVFEQSVVRADHAGQSWWRSARLGSLRVNQTMIATRHS